MGETKEGIIMFYLGFLARVGLFVFRIYAKHLTKNRVKPNALDTDTVWDVGFRYTYLPEEFIEELCLAKMRVWLYRSTQPTPIFVFHFPTHV